MRPFRRRPRNLDLEKSVAGMQAGVLGVSKEDMLKAIDARAGDYYRADLHPQGDAAYDALKNFAFGGHNNPLIPELRADMNRFYGWNKAAPAPVAPANSPVTTAPAPVAREINTTPMQSPVGAPMLGPNPYGPLAAPAPVQEFKDKVVEKVKSMNPNVIAQKKDEYLEQAQQAAAQQMETIKNLGTNAAKQLEDMGKNDQRNLLISLGGLAAVGGGGALALSQPEEPELTDEEKLMLYLSQTS